MTQLSQTSLEEDGCVLAHSLRGVVYGCLAWTADRGNMAEGSGIRLQGAGSQLHPTEAHPSDLLLHKISELPQMVPAVGTKCWIHEPVGTFHIRIMTCIVVHSGELNTTATPQRLSCN